MKTDFTENRRHIPCPETASESVTEYNRMSAVRGYLAFAMIMATFLLSSLMFFMPAAQAAQNAKAYYVRQGGQIYYVRILNGRRYFQPVKSVPKRNERRAKKKNSGLGGLLSLFGFGGNDNKPEQKAKRPTRADEGADWQPFGESLSGRSYSNYRPSAPREREAESNEYDSGLQGGSFQTMCVRTCDGYYWPISYSVGRRQFARDESQCRSSCNAQVKLYYHNPRGDTANMVDLNGRAYRQLTNAFRYRKELVKNCKCRPDPWSEAAQQSYRIRAAREDGADGLESQSDKAATLRPVDDKRAQVKENRTQDAGGHG